MIPLLVIALGLSAAAISFETSPRTRVWADKHIRALRAAIAAHRTADGHLSAARAATDPTTGAQHAHEATAANRAAAEATAEAAKAARTKEQRATAAGSAKAVVERDAQVAAALAQLGVGQCDVRAYAKVTPEIRDALIAKLHAEGMTVTGDNPWDIDTHEHDVKLRAVWDARVLQLKLIVTAGKGGSFGLVTCSAIWDKVDPIVKAVISDGGGSVAPGGVKERSAPIVKERSVPLVKERARGG